MSKFDLDYNHISTSIDKKSFKYEDVKDKLVKVAFDLVRFRDNDKEELWQIQNADDGSPVIVALYEEDDTKKEASHWQVGINKTAGDINIFYKNRHLTKIASSDIGVDNSELDTVKRFLPKKLASDKSLSKALLNDLPSNEREELLRLHPELA